MLVILNLNQMLNIGVTIPRCAPGYFVIDELQEEHADMSEMKDERCGASRWGGEHIYYLDI